MKNLDEIKFDAAKRGQAGMTVPEGFFEQFQQQLEAKIDTLEAVKPAPVIEMPRRSYKMATRWAIAACCTLLVGIGAVISFQTEDSANATEAVEMTAQSEEETEMEEMIIRSVNDFELYDYYCEL